MFLTFIACLNSRTTSPKPRYLFRIFDFAYLEIAYRPWYTSKRQTHSYRHYESSHYCRLKNSIPRRQLLHLRRLCSNDHFNARASEMCSLFKKRDYPSTKFQTKGYLRCSEHPQAAYHPKPNRENSIGFNLPPISTSAQRKFSRRTLTF